MRVETQHDLAQEEVRNIEMPVEFLRPRTQGDSEKGILVLAHCPLCICVVPLLEQRTKNHRRMVFFYLQKRGKQVPLTFGIVGGNVESRWDWAGNVRNCGK